MSSHTDKMEEITEMMDTSINLLDYILDDVYAGMGCIEARSGRVTTTLNVLFEQLKQIKCKQSDLTQEMINEKSEEQINEN